MSYGKVTDYRLVYGRTFGRSLKKLKRFHSAKSDIQTGIRVILKSPRSGASIRGYPNIRKLRVRNTDISRGKSSGYRLLYSVTDDPPIIYLLYVYSKLDKENVTPGELRQFEAELDETISGL